MNKSLQIAFTVAHDVQTDRLDRWLANQISTDATLPELSRSRLKNLILDGQVILNGKIFNDPSTQLRGGETITLTLPPPVATTPKPENIPLDVLFEDEHLIVINKPAGIVTHPAPGSPDGTLVNALLAHCGESLTGIGGEKRPGIVHRLDKDTSGVMMAAKTEKAHHRLTEMFAAHDLERVYTALVWGVPTMRKQTIDAPIARHRRERKKMCVHEKGRHAITHLDFIRTLPPLASLAKCQLETGRTHQIRVHTAHIGHGIIGDPSYGRPMRAGQMPDQLLRSALGELRSFPRQALHASLLGFDHPITKEEMRFETDMPQDMQDLVNNLENAIKMRGHL